MQKVVLSCLAILVATCLCLSVLAVAGAASYLIFETSSSQSSAQPTPSSISPLPGIDPNDSNLPADVRAQMEQIEQQVVTLRGLAPATDIQRGLFSTEDLRQRVLNDFIEDYTFEEAQEDVLALAAFGLLPPGFDLLTLYEELLSEQIAGFYDDETKEMVVVQGAGFGGVERMTYAHEYTHALQDANYDITDGLGYSDELCEQDSERCAAIQALLEGDASLLEETWLYEQATQQDMDDIIAFYSSYSSPVYERAPLFLQQDFLFPYTTGKEFVDYFYADGAWAAVDALYANPPVTTEQILHPEKYPDDRPLPVELPDLAAQLDPGWEVVDEGVLGEWYTVLVLGFGTDASANLIEGQARSAASGWGGDAYRVYANAERSQTVLVLLTEWDAVDEAEEFSRSFRDYAAGRFGAEQADGAGQWAWNGSQGSARLVLSGATTLWVLAPDTALADTLAQAILQP